MINVKILYVAPAYTITEADLTKSFKAGDVFAVAYTSTRYGTMHRFYTFGSVVSYALQNNECPIKSFENAKVNGHETHWANQNATALTAHKQAHRTHVALKVGDVVKFEGREFSIENAPNHNIKLREV